MVQKSRSAELSIFVPDVDVSRGLNWMWTAWWKLLNLTYGPHKVEYCMYPDSLLIGPWQLQVYHDRSVAKGMCKTSQQSSSKCYNWLFVLLLYAFMSFYELKYSLLNTEETLYTLHKLMCHCKPYNSNWYMIYTLMMRCWTISFCMLLSTIYLSAVKHFAHSYSL